MRRVGVVLKERLQCLDAIADRRIRRVSAGSTTNGDRRERRPEIRRAGGLPGFVLEVEPRPRAFEITASELQRPHVGEGLAQVVAHDGGCGVASRENERIQYRLGAARLARFRQADGLVGIERLDLSPQPNTRDHVLDDLPFTFAPVSYTHLTLPTSDLV